MAYLLAISMIVITLLVYVFARSRISSPAMLFMIPFSFSCFYLTMNLSRWSVILHDNTFRVIVFGSLAFLFGVFCASSRVRIRLANRSEAAVEDDSFSNGFLWLFFFLEVLILLLCFRQLRIIVHRAGFHGSISYEIYRFRNLGIYTTTSTSFGQGLDWLYRLNMSAGYVWAYVIAYRLVHRKRLSLSLLLCLAASIASGLMRGGRQSAVQLVAAMLVCYLLFYFGNTERRHIPFKNAAIAMMLVLAIAFTFQYVGVLLGRTVRADFSQYLAVYLCGSIRNLNEWLRNSHPLPAVFGKMTFGNLYPYLGRKLGRSDWIYMLDLPYLSANGRNSGNIYTTFYAFIYDFGYIGAFVMPFLMGLISEFVYKRASSARVYAETDLRLSVLLYSYISYQLVFSFFSNKFYEGIVSLSFIKQMIIWCVMAVAAKYVRVSFKSRGPSIRIIRRSVRPKKQIECEI